MYLLKELWRQYFASYRGLSREIWLLASVTLVNRAGAMVLPFLSVYLTTEQGLSLLLVGWVMAAYGLGAVTGNYVGGWLTDRYGYYPVMKYSLWAAMVLFIGFAHLDTFWLLCIGMFTLSAVADLFRPANMAAIGAYSRPENMARSISLIRLAINLGFAVGPAAAGIMAVRIGYDSLFYVDGITCGLAGILLWRTLSPRKVSNTDTTASKLPDSRAALLPDISAYKNRRFLQYVMYITLAALVFMQIFSTYPVFLEKELGITTDKIGLLMSFNGSLIVLLEMPITHQLTGRVRNLKLVIISIGILAVSFLLLPIGYSWVWVIVLAMAVLTVSEMIMSPFGYAHALEMAPLHRRGQYMGLYGMTFSIAHLIGPLLGFYVAEKLSFANLWFLCGLLCLISALGIIGLMQKDRLANQLG